MKSRKTCAAARIVFAYDAVHVDFTIKKVA
jgi:hypothetical protein